MIFNLDHPQVNRGGAMYVNQFTGVGYRDRSEAPPHTLYISGPIRGGKKKQISDCSLSNHLLLLKLHSPFVLVSIVMAASAEYRNTKCNNLIRVLENRLEDHSVLNPKRIQNKRNCD